MTKISKRTCSFPAETAAFTDRFRGGRANLRALQQRDAAFERWLRQEVMATYDATKADPSRRIPAKKVFAEARARYTR